MGNTATRLWIVTVLVAVAYGATYLVQTGMELPEVKLPDWTFHDMPQQLGTWLGEDTELDPKITAAVGAEAVVDRNYRNEREHSITVHTAIFIDPTMAVYHTPMSCYKSAGWELVEEGQMHLQFGEQTNVAVSLTTWEKEGQRILVAYWYKLGKHVFLTRLSLGQARWAMRGQDSWPATIKVMLQTSVNNPDDAKTDIADLAEQIGKWIDQPSHQTQHDDK